MDEQMMTLKELCRSCGVSRRAVQGYEQRGYVAPSGKNEHGYLLYDWAARQRIEYIHRLQRYGFRLSEIGTLLQLPPKALQQRLTEQLPELELRRNELEKTIRQLSQQIEDMI